MERGGDLLNSNIIRLAIEKFSELVTCDLKLKLIFFCLEPIEMKMATTMIKVFQALVGIHEICRF